MVSKTPSGFRHLNQYEPHALPRLLFLCHSNIKGKEGGTFRRTSRLPFLFHMPGESNSTNGRQKKLKLTLGACLPESDLAKTNGRKIFSNTQVILFMPRSLFIMKHLMRHYS